MRQRRNSRRPQPRLYLRPRSVIRKFKSIIYCFQSIFNCQITPQILNGKIDDARESICYTTSGRGAGKMGLGNKKTRNDIRAKTNSKVVEDLMITLHVIGSNFDCVYLSIWQDAISITPNDASNIRPLLVSDNRGRRKNHDRYHQYQAYRKSLPAIEHQGALHDPFAHQCQERKCSD